MILPHGETLIVWRRPARDRHGDTSYVEHHEIDSVAIVYGSQDEPNPGGDPTADRPLARYELTCYCPVGSDVLANDIVEPPGGQKYHVVGRPIRPRHPRSNNSPAVIVYARRIEG
ncbi:hypothetical protein OG563_26450 [Nocardia vinacea]|uniref:Head-to-tail stopper n=1 Tax=Nocardia vinacea TaxID=96468 RepID=A0ABZ1YI19_9NOCA|nr:hypothetical protein [Nocardia vinacea]